MQNAGFAVEYATYYFSPLLPAILIGRVFSSRWFQASEPHLLDSVASRREHQLGGAIYAPVRTPLLGLEIMQVKAERRFPFGASCLVVARKV